MSPSKAKEYAASIGSHSFMLVDGSGVVIAQWGPVDEPLHIFSIRKSIVSALYGILAAEGLVGGPRRAPLSLRDVSRRRLRRAGYGRLLAALLAARIP